MEVNGKIDSILEMQTGEGKNGTWQKQEYILETDDSKYPKKVCFAVWGDKIGEFGIKQGESLIASIEIESREFNGKWYTNVQCWRVQKTGEAQPTDDKSKVTDGQGLEKDELPF